GERPFSYQKRFRVKPFAKPADQRATSSRRASLTFNREVPMRSRFFRIFALPMLVVACCVLPAFGGDSSVKIIGPSEVEAGNLVVLRAEAPGACVWASVPPVDFLTFDDQKTLVFAS